MTKSKLKIVPIGGLGEIGMNCMALEWGDELILIDCGILFPDVSYPGVELIAPDLDYVHTRKEKLRGLVITHGHEDHIGAVPFLLKHAPADIFCTPFSRGLIGQKLQEFEGLSKATFHKMESHKRFRLGSFSITPLPVQHSIIEAHGLVIETPVGTVVHSGDFKHDANRYRGKKTDFSPFEKWGSKGIRVLLSDSTNAERPGHTLSEDRITESFERIFAKQKKRLIIALFASNVRRVGNLLQAAHQMDKRVAFVGRSVHSYSRLGHELGSLEIPENTLILAEHVDDYPDDQVIILATGSQAEPQSALVRMAEGIHKEVQIRHSDCVILSSRFIPGNERAINNMMNNLHRLGAEVVYRSLDPIHASGHGFQDELKMMLKACRPEFFIPVHGEYRFLTQHAQLAEEMGVDADNIFVVENGQIMELTEHALDWGDRLELQRVPIVNNVLLEANETVFNERNKMAKAGIVFFAMVRDAQTLKLVHPPQVNAYGLLLRSGEEYNEVLSGAISVLTEAYEQHARRKDLAEVLRIELRRYLRKRVSHKPIVIPNILDV